ncbi:MAG: FtsX-like permease family protein [Desulfobacterota bacterium]|nr:FtsX-like permease family protein [Thermodesulfobacteriota bacterium]
MMLVKCLPLLAANLMRKKTRTILTVGSFGIAVFLFSLLATIESSFNQGVEVAGADRLVVINKNSIIHPLPLAYMERILQVRGVKEATYAVWFNGIYQDEKNFFPQLAIDHTTYRRIFREFKIDDKQWEAFRADREGCIVGRKLIQRFGWRLGDRIPIQGSIWPGTWEFNIRAIYSGTREEDDENQFWFRYDYFDERRDLGKGTVGWYIVRVEDPDKAVHVAKAIEDRFANSPYETTAETERSFAAGITKQIGSIKAIMLSVGSIVFFTLLFVTGSTMAMSVRERTGELAILKTLGFSDGSIMGLVLAEALLYALVGGCLGVSAAKLFSLRGDPTGGFLPSFYLSPHKMCLGVLFALIAGVAAGIIPSVLAMRLKIVEALRRV